MRIRIYPYRQGSRSARALADALGGRVLRLEGSTFNPRRDDVIINWGSSDPLEQFSRVINSPLSVQIATNKLVFFNHIQQTDQHLRPLTPRFWTNREDIPDDAFPIVARTVLRGHSGNGIVMCDTRADLVNAPLYVQYVKKEDEYRVHIIGEEVILIQRKARDRSVEHPNWRVRNHQNGFVFIRYRPNVGGDDDAGGRAPIEAPQQVLEQSKAAINALGLDFGAVDVIFNRHQGRAYVLEVNTAPGLEGTTVDDYANGFKNYLKTRS